MHPYTAKVMIAFWVTMGLVTPLMSAWGYEVHTGALLAVIPSSIVATALWLLRQSPLGGDSKD